MTAAVEKAIRDANLGVNPQAEGQVIRVRLPELTEDRRKELAKVAHKYAEQAKIAVRNVRRDGMEALKKLEKDHKISQDDHKRGSDEIQKGTDGHIKKIDELLATKEKEIMHV
jgi:ribosome recycling factor